MMACLFFGAHDFVGAASWQCTLLLAVTDPPFGLIFACHDSSYIANNRNQNTCQK
jgi:hypothetical protein